MTATAPGLGLLLNQHRLELSHATRRPTENDIAERRPARRLGGGRPGIV